MLLTALSHIIHIHRMPIKLILNLDNQKTQHLKIVFSQEYH